MVNSSVIICNFLQGIISTENKYSTLNKKKIRFSKFVNSQYQKKKYISLSNLNKHTDFYPKPHIPNPSPSATTNSNPQSSQTKFSAEYMVYAVHGFQSVFFSVPAVSGHRWLRYSHSKLLVQQSWTKWKFYRLVSTD